MSFSTLFLKSLLEQLPPEDPDYVYNMGCLLYQEGKYEEACKKFMSAMQVLGFMPGDQSETHNSPQTVGESPPTWPQTFFVEVEIIEVEPFDLAYVYNLIFIFLDVYYHMHTFM